MYPNLRAEMARLKYNGAELAEKLNITNSTFSLKLNGKSDFTLEEAFMIKKLLGVDMPIETLFAVEQ